MFLHGGVIHLLVNMYALYGTGRFCEQLFGRVRFVLVYFVSGIAGSAASLWWNPFVHSVGASGAVFGVYGALLVFMLDKRNGVPYTIMQTHQASIAVFIAYSLFNGFSNAGIDNAAHLGGLAAGALLGWTLSRPLGEEAAGRRFLKPVAGVTAAATAVAVLLALTPNTLAPYNAQQRFLADIKWFTDYEKQLLQSSKATLEKLGKTPGPHFHRDVTALAEQWGHARQRFAAPTLDRRLSRELLDLQSEMVAYTDLRRQATLALSGLAQPSPKARQQASQEFNRLWKEGNAVIQRVKDRGEAIVAEQKSRRR
jgi:rhomboid protease GluP